MKDKKSILRAEGLCKIFRHQRLDEIRAIMDVELRIEENEYVVFWGASGSGKTTLLCLLGGIERPTRGRVYLCGEEMTRFSDAEISRIRRKSIGFVMQNYNLLPHLSAWENVAIPLLPMGLREKDRFRRAFLLLERLGLRERINHTPRELSGGEQQRVSIARALINDPDLVLADEPTSNIDADSRAKALAILKEFQCKGKTILVNTNDPAHFDDANMLYELSRGRIVGKQKKK